MTIHPDSTEFHKFVGVERQAEVARLRNRFDEVAATGRPAMVVYVAQPGWGKTRIIQEFYSALAADQPKPAFWPPSLVTFAQSREGFIGLTASRKAVRHRKIDPPPTAEVPWLWLAPAPGRYSDGSAAPALSSLVDQLARCLPSLLGVRAPDRLDADLMTLLAATLSFTDIAELALKLGDAGQELLHTAFTVQRRLAKGSPDNDDAGSAHRDPQPARVGALLRSLLLPVMENACLPAVIVLDDAHDLDAATVEFLAEVLAMELPVLVLVTTWPDRLHADSSPSPFAEYLAESGHGAGFTQVVLGRLQDDDLITYLAGRFPDTDPQVLSGLALRADGNPYSLQLLLNTPRVLAAAGSTRIDLTLSEINELNSGLERLLGEHWAQLPMGVRQVLVTAAMLGMSFHEVILEECLRQITPRAGLEQAIASAWIQHVGGRHGVLEFIEYLRYEVARGDEPNVLSQQQRRKVQEGALDAITWLLADDDSPMSRKAILTLHVALAEKGIETNVAAAAQSAFELSEQTRTETQRQDTIRYLRLAVKWLESTDKSDWRLLAESHRELSNALRMEYDTVTAEPSARRAREIADEHGDADHQVRALCTLAFALRRRHDSTAYGECGRLVREAQDLAARTPALSPPSRRALLSIEAAKLGSDGKHGEARVRNEARITLCEEHYGPLHRHTLGAMEDTAYQAMRSGHVERAIELRREILARRERTAADHGYLQSAKARANLATTLLQTNDDEHLDEVELLVDRSLTLWSRAFGWNGRRTEPGRMIRARMLLRRGLAAEREGRIEVATSLFTEGATETAAIVALRAERPPNSLAIALERHGTALACLRDLDSLAVLGRAMSIRRGQLRQDDSFWYFRRIARTLCWAYERLGRRTEADSIRRRYNLDEPHHSEQDLEQAFTL